MADLDFRLFGTVRAIGPDGSERALGPRKERAVLAMLLIQPGRVLPLDRMIAQLWGDEPPASAVTTVQAYISHLRRSLREKDALITRDPGYLIAATTDLDRFSSRAGAGRRALADGDAAGAVDLLDAALAEWTGEPLAEFAEETFARPAVAQLANLHADAVQDRAEARLLRGDVAWCVTELDRLVAGSPYRERLWELYAAALYRAGRPADALAAIRRIRELLDDDLGLEPGPGLRDLETAILNHDGTAIPGRDPVRPPAPAPIPPSVEKAALVGRAGQLSRIASAVDRLRTGHGGLLLLSGEAGIGKTTLAQAAADRAATLGLSTGWGRGAEDDAAPAYWIWTQAFPPAAALLADPDDDVGDLDHAVFRLHQRMTGALTAATPILLVLDDLQWADAPSLRLLEFAVRHRAAAPVLIVATVRAEEGDRGGTLRDVLGRLAREPGAERITVPAFTRDEVGAYLQGHALDPGRAGAMLDRSGGNPFYLSELCRLDDLGGHVPDSVREVIARRAARLPDDTRALLRTAAVAGREVPLDVLAAATGTDAERVMRLLEPAVAAGLLTEAGEWDYRFAHALVRDALDTALTRRERARLHLRIAESLENLGAGGTAEGVTRLAHHFGQSARIGGGDRAAGYASRAAAQATARHAHDRAVALWEQALAAGAGPSYPLLIELGRSRRLAGDPGGSREALRAAIDAAGAAGDDAAVIRAVTVLGDVTPWLLRPYGVVDESMVRLLEGLLAGPLDDTDRTAVLGVLAVELYYGPRRADGQAHAAEAVAVARRLGGTPLLAAALNGRILSCWEPEHEATRRAAAEEMLALPGLARAAELVARVHRMGVLIRAAELDEYDADLARCRQLLTEVRRPDLDGVVTLAVANRLSLDRRWDELAELASAYRESQVGTTFWGRHFNSLIALFTARRGQGRVAEVVDDLVGHAEDPVFRLLRPSAVLAVAEAGDDARARELIARWGTDIPHDWSTDFAVAQWALVSARLGVPDRNRMHALLMPYADWLVTSGTGGACWGSARGILEALEAARDEATGR